MPVFSTATVIGHYFLLIFLSIFDPTSLHIPYPFFSPLCLSLLCSFLLCIHTHERTTRTQYDWYNWSPNNSSTGLPTFRNSPVVVPLHLDPVLEPPPPPPNAPTTQSSRLPEHGAQVGVCPPHEDLWLSQGSSQVLQQDRPDRLLPCNEPRPLTLRETCHFLPEQGRSSHHPPGSQRHRPTGSL